MSVDELSQQRDQCLKSSLEVKRDSQTYVFDSSSTSTSTVNNFQKKKQTRSKSSRLSLKINKAKDRAIQEEEEKVEDDVDDQF